MLLFLSNKNEQYSFVEEKENEVIDRLWFQTSWEYKKSG